MRWFAENTISIRQGEWETKEKKLWHDRPQTCSLQATGGNYLTANSATSDFVMVLSRDVSELGDDGFVDSSGVRIHCVTRGAGPLVVLIHGLADMWLMPEALNDTWRYLEKELTLVTVPKAGHWVHLGPVQGLGAADLVTRRMVSWLTQE